MDDGSLWDDYEPALDPRNFPERDDQDWAEELVKKFNKG